MLSLSPSNALLLSLILASTGSCSAQQRGARDIFLLESNCDRHCRVSENCVHALVRGRILTHQLPGIH